MMRRLFVIRMLLVYFCIIQVNYYAMAADTQPPTAPSNLATSVITNSTITLLWNASTDDIGIIRYEIYLNGTWKANVSPSTQHFTYTVLTPNTTYSVTVATTDAAGNWVVSTALSIKTSTVNTPISFYVSSSGNNNNSGTTINTPWKTITRVNEQTYNPGDKILFKNGETFVGGLVLNGNGTSVQPITVASYDPNLPKPIIEGQGNVVDAILLYNCSYWVIKDLEVSNLGTTRGQYRSGVTLKSTAGTTIRGLTLSNLYVHHTNSMLDKGNEGAGIYIDSENAGSNFDGVLIEKNSLYLVDRNGISQRTVGNAIKSRNIIIRNNYLEDIGGDCIKLWGSISGLIEHNTVKGGMRRAVDASAGIWPFYSDSTLIQYNEVSGIERCIDGQAFDSDYLTTNSIFQYNYSHDNQGGFMLLCAPNTQASNGAIVRYNISQNDGIQAADYIYPGIGYNEGAVFTLGGNVTNSQIYNNTIYVRAGKNIPLVRSGSWDSGVPSANYFSNNIFYVDGAVSYISSAGEKPIFDNNVYYGTHTNRPTDAHAITAKPNLVNVNSGGNGMSTLDGYKFSSLDVKFAGILKANNGGFDFWGNTVSQTAPPLVGAHDIPTGLVGSVGSYENWDLEVGALNQWGMWNDVSVTSNCMLTGSYGLQIAGSPAASERQVALKPNTKYTFGGWAKLGLGNVLSIGVKNYGGIELSKSFNNTVWQNQEITFTTGNTNTSATVYFYQNQGTGTSCGDDFYLKESSIVTELTHEIEITKYTAFYPNPVENILNFNEIRNWELCSVIGETIAKGESETINMSSLPSGVYVVKTASEIHKIVKN